MDQRLQPLATVSAALLFGLACGVGYKEGVTIESLAESNGPKKLLVEYLQVASADVAACDVMRRDGPSVRSIDSGVVRAVNDAFDAGTLAIELWTDCTLNMWRGRDPVVRASLEKALVRQVDRLVKEPGLTDDAELRARGHAVIRVLEQRAADASLAEKQSHTLLKRAETRRALVGDSQRAAALLDRLVAALELEAGLHEGEPVTSEQVSAAEDQELLLRWARRLPHGALREAAGARLIEMRVANSPFASVRDRPLHALEAVGEHGWLPMPEDAIVRSASWEPGADAAVMLRLLQNYRQGWAKLLPSDRREVRTPDASVDLRGSLWVQVEGYEEPITVCPGADEWDPTPCVPPQALQMRHAVAVLAPTGRVRIDRELSLDEVLTLGTDGDRLSAQVLVGGVVASIDLPIFYDSVPEMLGLAIGGAGDGADLRVELWELSNQRLLIELEGVGRRTWRALVPMDDAAFRIASIGVAAGSRGVGGDIRVRMRCTNCAEVRAWVVDKVTSTGGAGMRGGEVTIRRVRED